MRFRAASWMLLVVLTMAGMGCIPGGRIGEMGYDCSGHGEKDPKTSRCLCLQGYSGMDCARCAPGYQDNNNDAVCRPSCAMGSPCGAGQRCDDASGEIECVCASSSAGGGCDQCSAGYQDNDRDGRCRVSCSLAGYNCSGHGSCDDTGGTARCDCDSGYQDDQQGHCVNAASANTYIVTAVKDELDNTDLGIMASGLDGLGYTQDTSDTNVSTSELASYLRKNVGILYHTGHGYEGQVVTSDGTLNSQATTINVSYTIFATCLTMTDTSWRKAMGPSANTIMGYTKVSFDPTDNEVARQFTSDLAKGQTPLQAWYFSNIGQTDLKDRWAAYTREGASVVEYSARNGNVPRAALPAGSLKALAGVANLRVAEGLLSDTTRFADRFQVLRITGDQKLTTESLADEPLPRRPSALSFAQAVSVAEKWLSARAELPADAVLEKVIPLQADRGDGTTASTVGHVVVYGRKVGELAVKGNRTPDHLTVLVGADSVLSISRYWPTLAAQRSFVSDQNLLPVGEAIQRAAASLSRLQKGGSLDLVESRPVYGTRGEGASSDRLVPAYELTAADGTHVVIDATTGEVL